MTRTVEQSLRDPDLVNIAKSAAASFTNLSQDEQDTCVLEAIWKATLKYDDSIQRTSFSSYVFNGVRMLCLAQLRFNNKSPSGKLHNSISDGDNQFESVDIEDELESTDDPQLMRDRYYGGYWYSELGESRDQSGEWIRQKIERMTEKLRRKHRREVYK